MHGLSARTKKWEKKDEGKTAFGSSRRTADLSGRGHTNMTIAIYFNGDLRQ